VDTSVRLVVDGKVVRNATGPSSEALDWAHFDVADLRGRTAHLELVDNNTGGWGHISADQFNLSDIAAETSLQRAHWLDHGSDDYAGVTYNDAPGGKRILVGWMNNWNYAGSIPTSPWRSAMTVPRELSLTPQDGVLRLAQRPVKQLDDLAGAPILDVDNLRVPEGTKPLNAGGAALRIDATLQGSGSQYGLKVRTGNGQETVIGYDRVQGEVYLDRSASGDVTFDPSFTRRHQAPLKTQNGLVHLTILVDWSSVEVFAENGRVLLTDQVFPDPSSTGVSAFATGGSATLKSLTVRPVRSAWTSQTG
jgi:levanase